MYIKLVIFSVMEDALRVYLPGATLPKSEITSSQSLDQAAERLFAKVIPLGKNECYQEQLYTFSETKKREIVVTYFMLAPFHLLSETTEWVKVGEASQSQEKEIIEYAVQRLRWKVEYTNIVYSLLPREFTLSEMQAVYEAILGRTLDKRNFRKKILALRLVKATGERKKMGKARPAELFMFRERKLKFVEVL